MDGPADQQQLLDSARARLLAAPAETAAHPSLLAGAPLRQVPDAVKARILARALAGETPLGAAYPRAGLWRRVVVPLGAVALLDAVGIGVAAAAGKTGLLIGAVVVLVLVGAVAAAGAVSARRDPLRFTRGERAELVRSQTWESRLDWNDVPADNHQRAVVASAARAAGRIVISPALASPTLDGHRAQLDLTAELDAIDARAHAVRSDDQPGAAASHEYTASRDAVLDRAAALTCYADRLEAVAAATPPGQAPTVDLDELARLTWLLNLALTAGAS